MQIVNKIQATTGHVATQGRALKCLLSLVCLPALLVSCGMEDMSGADGALGVAKQAITYPSFGTSCTSTGACSVAIINTQGIPETQFVFAAPDFVHVNDRASVNSVSGVTPVAASGGDWARIGVDTTVGHFLSPNKYLQVGNTNWSGAARKLYGDLYSGGSATDPSLLNYLAQSKIGFSNKLIEPATDTRQPRMESNVIWSFAWPTTVLPSPIVQNKSGTYYLTSGLAAANAYSDITINSGQTLTLTAGTYFINSLTVNSGGNLNADTSQGVVRLAVGGSYINLNGPVVETLRKNTTGAAEPSRFLLAYVGSATNVNANRGIQGVLVAPDAAISLWGARGAAFGNSVEVHQEIKVVSGFSSELLQNPGTTPQPNHMADDNTIRFVPGLGYLDGRTCDHWPLDLQPATYVSAMNADATADAKTATQKIITELQRVTGNTNPVVTAFGSMKELVITSYSEYSAATSGLERRYVVVDPETKRGYDISYVRLCRQTEDLNSDSCSYRQLPVSINGAAVTVEIYGRTTPDDRVSSTDESYKSVELIAPTVRVEPPLDLPRLYGRTHAGNRIELDVNLIIAASEVVYGIGAAGVTGEIEVRPYAVPTAGSFGADINTKTRPGVLAVLGSKVTGLSALATFNGARVSQVTCYDAPGYTPKTGYTTTDMFTTWRVAPSTTSKYITTTRPELHLAKSVFSAAVPFRSTKEAGGFAGVVGSTTSAIALYAPSMDGVEAFNCPITTPGYGTLAESTLSVTSEQAGLQSAAILSNGLLFTSMVNAAEVEGMQTTDGRPSARYTNVAAALDKIAPDGQTTIVDAATQGRVRGFAAAIASSNTKVSLNALAVPYGDLAKPWLPNEVNPSTARTVNEMMDCWDDVAQTVDNMTTAMNDAATKDQLDTLVAATKTLAAGLSTFAGSIQQAAIEDQINQGEALSNIQNAMTQLDKAQTDFLTAMCSALKLSANCGWEDVSSATKANADQVIKACAANHKSGGWLDVLSTVASVCPYISAGVTAFKTFQAAWNALDAGKNMLATIKAGYSAATGKAKEDNKAFIDYAGQAATSLSESKDKISGVLDKLGMVNTGECPTDDSAAKQAEDIMAGLATTMAVVSGMAIQAQTIHAILQSVGSTLEYQVSNEQAAVALNTSALKATGFMQKYSNGDDIKEKNTRAAYIAETCKLTRSSVRTGEAEILGMIHRLQTSAGKESTTALASVPRHDLTNANEVESTYPFVDSLWNTTSLKNWFDSNSSTSAVNAVRDRFVTLVDRTCDTGSSLNDNIPPTLMYVKKRLTGQELAAFKARGFVKISIGLEDLAKSSVFFSDTSRRLSATSYLEYLSNNSWKRLSAPVVYGAMYSGCTGTTEGGADPCCDNASCRTTIEEESPFLVRMGSARVPSVSGCVEGKDWELSNTPMDLTDTGATKQDVRTCLKNVQTSPLRQQMSPIDLANLNNPTELMKPVRNDFCNAGPADLNFAAEKLWGTPLFGDWSVGYNKNTALVIQNHTADELDGNCVPVEGQKLCDGLTNIFVDGNWTADVAGLTGLELTIVVGAEPLAAAESSKYQQTDYRSTEWRDWLNPDWANYTAAN